MSDQRFSPLDYPAHWKNTQTEPTQVDTGTFSLFTVTCWLVIRRQSGAGVISGNSDFKLPCCRKALYTTRHIKMKWCIRKGGFSHNSFSRNTENMAHPHTTGSGKFDNVIISHMQHPPSRGFYVGCSTSSRQVPWRETMTIQYFPLYASEVAQCGCWKQALRQTAVQKCISITKVIYEFIYCHYTMLW